MLLPPMRWTLLLLMAGVAVTRNVPRVTAESPRVLKVALRTPEGAPVVGAEVALAGSSRACYELQWNRGAALWSIKRLNAT